MVCGADHEDAVVGFQSVHFVEEIAAYGVGDNAVEIFEDEEARGHLSGAAED